MKLFFYTVCLSVATLVWFSGCSKNPPKCSDDLTTNSVKNLIIKHSHLGNEFNSEDIRNKMQFEYIRPTAFDEKIKKYSCEADLIIGDDYKVSIKYESQLSDDESQQLISVFNISLEEVKDKIIESIFSCPKSNEFCILNNGIYWSSKTKDYKFFDEAKDYCKSIGGRLPTISELRTLIQNCPETETGGTCKVKDDCSSGSCWNDDACRGCSESPDGKYSKFRDTGWFWSSSAIPEYSNTAWSVSFNNGYIKPTRKDSRNRAITRCVK